MSRQQQRYRLFLALLVGMTLMLAACGKEKSTTPLDYKDKVEGIDLSQENPQWAEWGKSEAEIKKDRGEPNRRMKQAGDNVVLEYADYQYSLIRDSVEVYVLMPGQETAKGIKAGGPASEIANAYGKDFYKRTQNNMDIIGYIDKKLERALEFVIQNGQISTIIVSRFSLFK
ncbi:hypothetical protein PCCS19_33940 [Paenibacillus sp. CCS19]|uniref:hypothetical protein n=1 Tax=Paenibacillus sp. CCS19 TaxID=3158387 RepID=UPI00256725D7|nr:hypothetical protein [Paenibacillus cellulosilyticus]GMK40338.1 hypothetical protein PCCS19_33940 [Paenibacillus cellulosilyticus]